MPGDMCQIKIPERSPWEATIWIWRQSLSCNGNLNMLEIPGPWMSIKKAADTKWERKRQGRRRMWSLAAELEDWGYSSTMEPRKLHEEFQNPHGAAGTGLWHFGFFPIIPCCTFSSILGWKCSLSAIAHWEYVTCFFISQELKVQRMSWVSEDTLSS